MSAAGPQPDKHMIDVVAGTLISSDYPAVALGTNRVVARCSCGWSTQRTHGQALWNQVAKHRDWAELEGSKGRHPSSRRRADLTVPPVDGDQ